MRTSIWLLLALLAGVASADYYINTPGLTTLVANSPPIIINTTGVILDCNGYYTSNNCGGAGNCYSYINSAFSNTEIRNCNIGVPGGASFVAGSMDLTGNNIRVYNVTIRNSACSGCQVPPNGQVYAHDGSNFILDKETGANINIVNMNGCSINRVSGTPADALNQGANPAYMTAVTNCNLTNSGTTTMTISGSNNVRVFNSTTLFSFAYSNNSNVIINSSRSNTWGGGGGTTYIYGSAGYTLTGWLGNAYWLNGTNGVTLRDISTGGTVQYSSNVATYNATPGLTINNVNGFYIGPGGNPSSLTLIDTSTVSSASAVNFSSLSITRGGSMNFFGGWIGSLTIVNSSAIQTSGPINSINLDGAIQCNFNGISTNNTTLMLNTVEIIRSQDINIAGFTGNAYMYNSFGLHCPFYGSMWGTFRSYYMNIRNGSSGITFDNMTILGNGIAPPTYGTRIPWLMYVYNGASGVTMQNSIINATMNVIYDENIPSVVTLSQNGYGQTMYGTKNISGILVGRTSPLLYVGEIGSDYPWRQNTSNHSFVAGTIPCSPYPVPQYDVYNVVDNSPLTWRLIQNGTLNVSILYPANQAYLGTSYTFPVYYTIQAGAGLRNCGVAMKKDGTGSYQVTQTIPCGTGAGEMQIVNVTSPSGGGYTLYVSAYDNSGADYAQIHISFYESGSGGGGTNGTVCTNPNGCGGWYCSPDHPELCWQINQGNQSNPSYYDACVQSISQYGQNKSYIEKYLTCNFARLVGNAQMGGIMLALIVLGIFLAFVMMQNTRLDGKLVVMIPVIILVSVWMGWILWIVGFVIGGIIALAILRLVTR